MANNPTTPSAKEKVLAWVRSKNPQTMELKFGCVVEDVHVNGKWDVGSGIVVKDLRESDLLPMLIDSGDQMEFYVSPQDHFDCTIIGSDMGLQELLIAFGVDDYKLRAIKSGWVRIYKESAALRDHTFDFDLTENLHNQEPKFYEDILPLIPND